MLKNRNKYKKSNTVIRIPTRLVQPNPHQPRKKFDWESLEGLSESIKSNGLLQPITVRSKMNGRFELIAGERRLKACKMAGWPTIPAIILEIDEERSAIFSVLESLQREELHFFEEAEAIERLIKGFGMSQEEAAAKLGKSVSELSDKLLILRLPEEVRRSISEYGLTERHARALLRLPTAALMEQVTDAIAEQGLTAGAAEQLVSGLISKPAEPERKGKTVMVFKDVRIFINTLNHAVTTMRKSGINAVSNKSETEKYIEYTVRIDKPN